MATAATEVEMADCRLTPEFSRELQLTAEQQPKVAKAFAELAGLRVEIEESRRKLNELCKAAAEESMIEEQTRKLVAVENKCRDRLHPMLKPVLTNEPEMGW